MLRSVKVDFTNLCNASCPFCPYHGTSGSVTVRGKRQVSPRTSLSLLDMTRLADGLLDLGLHPVIKFSGRGEATTNPEFAPVVRLLRGRGFPVRLITNGLLLRQYAPLLAESGVHTIVSIHGTEDAHDAVIGRRGARALADAGIKALIERSALPEVAIILTAACVQELPALVTEYRELGLRVRLHHNFDLAARSLLDPEVVARAQADVASRYPDVAWVPALPRAVIPAYYGPQPYVLAPHQCSRYTDEIEVWSDGTVSVCDSEPFGDIRTDALKDVLEGAVRRGFLNTVHEELGSAGGLSPSRCDRCCYQEAQ